MKKKINLNCPMATLEQKSERSFQQSGGKGLEQLPKKEEGNRRVKGLIDPQLFVHVCSLTSSWLQDAVLCAILEVPH